MSEKYGWTNWSSLQNSLYAVFLWAVCLTILRRYLLTHFLIIDGIYIRALIYFLIYIFFVYYTMTKICHITDIFYNLPRPLIFRRNDHFFLQKLNHISRWTLVSNKGIYLSSHSHQIRIVDWKFYLSLHTLYIQNYESLKVPDDLKFLLGIILKSVTTVLLFRVVSLNAHAHFAPRDDFFMS